MKQMRMELKENSYNIWMERGILLNAAKYLNLNRKVFIVTDSKVPYQYAEMISYGCKDPIIAVIPEGEESKCLEQYASLLRKMVENNFSRKDCVVAVGGGVVGDLAGFVASSYMRGIDFYNVPTTTLSQVDSSIGGKVAIDFAGVKNIVGAFYQPKGVLIDPDVLKTQSHRQLVNGLAEAMKMGLILDKELFEIFEKGEAIEKIDEVIWRSLQLKKYVVEEDEKESGLRKILNFGHTLGHGIETAVGLGQLYHGECVGLGMLAITRNKEIHDRIEKALALYDLPTSYIYDKEEAFKAVKHDKKGSGNTTSVVLVKNIGEAVCENVETDSLKELL